MIRYWRQTPAPTAAGRRAIRAKSSKRSVIPIPNMIAPSSHLIAGSKCRNGAGQSSPASVTRMTQTLNWRVAAAERRERALMQWKTEN
jgi:hypothetical protein